MSIQAVAWALDQQLPHGPKLVLISIANHADHTDGYCWLKAETISWESCCLERSVYRILAALIRNGYLRREKRRGTDGKQRANDYWILFERLATEWKWRDAAEESETQDIVGDPDGVTESAPGDVEPQESLGPGDSDRIDTLLEPSKTKPREANIGLAGRTPRGYRTPPLPIASEKPQAKPKEFVYRGTRAWDAWVAYILKTQGRHWSLATSDGEGKTGWWWPTLFPPTDVPAAPCAEPANQG